MERIKLFFKRLFCEHIYGDGVMNPYIDQFDNRSAIYTCSKCGKKVYRTFYRCR